MEEHQYTGSEPRVTLKSLRVWRWIIGFRPSASGAGEVQPRKANLVAPPHPLLMTFWVVGEYVAVGAEDKPPTGKYRVYTDGELERESNMELEFAGRTQFAIPIRTDSIPPLKNADRPMFEEGQAYLAAGSKGLNQTAQEVFKVYEVEVELTYGESRDMDRVNVK